MSSTAHSQAPTVHCTNRLPPQRRWLLLCAAFWLCWLALSSVAPTQAQQAADAAPLLPIVAFLCLWLMAAVAGSRILCAIGLSDLPDPERLFFATLLGFTALSVGTFLLAASHGLYGWLLCAGFVVASLALAARPHPAPVPALPWRQWWQSLRQAEPAQQCALAVLALAIVLGTAGAMAPATDNDTLLYHLAAPSIYAQQHGFVYVPHNLWTNIPLFTEMLYTAGLCAMGQTLARLFVPCSYTLLLLGCWCFSRRHLPHTSPWLAPLLVGSIPLLAMLSCTNLNDVTLLAYELAALFAFVSLWRAAGVGERRAWFVLCCLACGAAAAIKYGGWLPAIVLLPAAMWRMGSAQRGRGALAAAAIALAAMVLPALWLIKNAVYTGNPVYPLAYSIFGGRNWSAELAAAYQAHMMSFGLHDEGLLGALKAPLVLVLDEARFGSKLGIGPLFLLLAPVLLWAVRRLPRLARFLLAYALAHYVAWLAGPQVVRYIMPGLLVWSFILAEAVGHLPGRPQRGPGRRSRPVGARALVQGIVCVGAACNVVWFALTQQALVHPFDALWGAASRRAYLQQQVPYYSTVSYANTALPPDAKLLFVGEWRTFYTKLPFAADTGPDATIICEYVNRADDLDALVGALRADGFTHLLYNPEGEALLHRTFGYLRFASADKERLYRQLPTRMKLVHAEHGVFLYELERSPQLATVAQRGPA